MGQIPPQKLVTDVQAGKFRPAYYFFGTEDFRIAEAAKYLAHQFLPDRQIMTNFLRLDGRKTKCPDLIAELSVLPMLGERQVFSISDFQSYKPTEIDRVLKLVSQKDPTRIVLLTSPSQRAPKKKSALIKKISAVADVVEFNRLTRSQTAAQVKARLVSAKLEIDAEAMNLFTSLLDGNRGALVSEVDKLVSYMKPGETVTAADIEKVAAGHQTHSIFELADYVADGQSNQALGLVHRLLAEGSSATGLLYFLGQHFISLYLVRSGGHLEPYRRWLEPKFRSQANRFEPGRLEEIVIQIAETDSALRHKRVVPELMLDQLVLQAMSK